MERSTLHKRLLAKGWRRDSKGRWGAQDGAKDRTFREACLLTGLISVPVVKRKPGPTPDLEKRNKKGELCSKGRVPPPTTLPRTLAQESYRQQGGSDRKKITERRRTRQKIKHIRPHNSNRKHAGVRSPGF